MELTRKERLTLNYYQNNAELWSKHRHLPINLWGNEYKTFKRLLPRGKIIDLGCDIGRDANVLTKLGYQYSGIDYSDKMIEIARQNNPTLQFTVMNILEMKKLIINLTDLFAGQY